MKYIKFIMTFLLLFAFGIFISYADIKYNNWTNDFIQAFEKTESNFKFYSIKVNCTVQNGSYNDIQNICKDTLECFNINTDEIKWIKENEKEGNNIYAEINDNYYKISFKAIKKNSKEYYIIIDISNNKVYKNIVDIYPTLKEVLNKYSHDEEISICVVGEYTNNLQLYKSNEILENILYNMNAKEIDKMREGNFLSVSAYSNLLIENDLEYLDNKINLNIGIRYSENEDKTLIYMATPIIKLDY